VFDEENVPKIEDIISPCVESLRLMATANIICLVHYTTREYFERTWHTWFPNAKVDIAKSCDTCLLYDSYEVSHGDSKEKRPCHVLYRYAAEHWRHQARDSSIDVKAIAYKRC
jgi:hypothetical protein